MVLPVTILTLSFSTPLLSGATNESYRFSRVGLTPASVSILENSSMNRV